jgi:hypothetical protein
MLSNLRCVRGQGVKVFVRRQQKRIALLEAMIEGYDDGRSRSFFCRAAALLEPATVKRSLARAKKTSSPTDRTRILRDLLVQAARRDAIEL